MKTDKMVSNAYYPGYNTLKTDELANKWWHDVSLSSSIGHIQFFHLPKFVRDPLFTTNQIRGV